MRRLQAVVFDLDGTLVDSAPDLAVAVNTLLAELGRPPLALAAVRPMIGDGAQRLVERALAADPDPPVPTPIERLTARFLAIYEPIVARSTRPFPGVAETLARLRGDGFRLAICTNKPERASRALLAALDLAAHFPVVVGGDSGPAKKPDPRPLLQALAGLGVARGAAAFVGDNEHDVATARGAKVPILLVSYGYSRVPVAELAADFTLDRFGALPEALADLERRLAA